MKRLMFKGLLIGAVLTLLAGATAQAERAWGRGFWGPRGGLHFGRGEFRGRDFVYGYGRLFGNRGGFIYSPDSGRGWGFRSGPGYWGSAFLGNRGWGYGGWSGYQPRQYYGYGGGARYWSGPQSGYGFVYGSPGPYYSWGPPSAAYYYYNSPGYAGGYWGPGCISGGYYYRW